MLKIVLSNKLPIPIFIIILIPYPQQRNLLWNDEFFFLLFSFSFRMGWLWKRLDDTFIFDILVSFSISELNKIREYFKLISLFIDYSIKKILVGRCVCTKIKWLMPRVIDQILPQFSAERRKKKNVWKNICSHTTATTSAQPKTYEDKGTAMDACSATSKLKVRAAN